MAKFLLPKPETAGGSTLRQRLRTAPVRYLCRYTRQAAEMFPEKRVLRRVRYLGRIVPLLGLPAETVSGTGAFWSRPGGGGGEERPGRPVAAFGHNLRLHPANQHSHTTPRIRLGDKRRGYFPSHPPHRPL